jgi:hypothetical protein
MLTLRMLGINIIRKEVRTHAPILEVVLNLYMLKYLTRCFKEMGAGQVCR